jgi:pectate lyase
VRAKVLSPVPTHMLTSPDIRSPWRRAFAALTTFAAASLAALTPITASAAIAFDSTATRAVTNAASTSWSHTVGTGTDRVLIVGLALEDTGTTSLAINSITYAGVAMTPVANSIATAGSSTLDRAQLYYLLNPASGANTISITFGGAVNGVSAGSVSLTGVAQSAPTAAAIKTATSGTTISVNIAVATAGSWIIDVANSGAGNATLTPGSSQTKRWGVGQTNSGGAGSTTAPAATGTSTVSWTASSSSQLALSAAVFAPSGGTTVTAPTITTQPASQTVTAGGSVTFNVAASGTSPFTYQWRFNGTNISGATSSTYSLSNVQSANAGNYSVVVTNSAGSATSANATLTVNAAATAPSITSQPASQTVAVGGTASFSVTATGTATLTYQWRFNGSNISGATSSTYSLSNVQTANAGSYTVVVSNSVGSVTSSTATLTVSTSTGSNTKYNLTGFATLGSGTTGGGIVAETDAAYRKVTTPLQFAEAIKAANATAGAVKVIEIMNDLNLGWNEIGSAVQTLSSTPFRAHATPKLHPTLITSGVSLCDIKPKSGLTIFSANGATIRHTNFNLKSTSNIIIRNLKFDEMWEWDEASKGDYDSNDWDFITLSNGGAATNIWIDHCTFTKAYDGIADMKKGTQYVTMSWCRYVGDDGATNSNSAVRRQIAALEANRSSYAFYNFLRTNGFSIEDIVQVIQGHDKGHLMGSNSLDSANATLSATFHHQWFQNVWDRCVPRLRGGNVHNYNNHVDDATALVAKRLRDTRAAAMSSSAQTSLNSTYSFNPFLNGSVCTEGGAVLVENSIFTDCLWPLRNNQTDVTDPTYTGKIKATDTIYIFHNADGTTTNVRGNSTDSGNPLGPFQAPTIAFSWNGFTNLPYAYTLDNPADLPALLQAGAGAGTLTWSKDNWLKTSY